MNDSRPTSPPPAGARAVSYRLVRVAARAHRQVAAALADHDLTPLHHAILQWAQAAGPVHQKALAACVGVDPGDLVKHLDTLQARDLLARERDPSDRRRQLVKLTPEGEAALERTAKAMSAVEEQVLGGLDSAQRGALSEFLDALLADS